MSDIAARFAEMDAADQAQRQSMGDGTRDQSIDVCSDDLSDDGLGDALKEVTGADGCTGVSERKGTNDGWEVDI